MNEILKSESIITTNAAEQSGAHTTDERIGEKDMMNGITYRFKGLDAQTIADRIIDRDRRFAEIDFASLSFDEKCEYMAKYYRFEYPIFDDVERRIDTTELVERLTERAEAGDRIAAFYLLSYPGQAMVGKDRRREIVSAAAEAGNLRAVALRFIHKRKDGYDESDYDLACAVLTSLADAKPSIDTSRAIISCYKVLKSFWTGRESTCDRIIADERERLLEWGYYNAVLTRRFALRRDISHTANETEREILEDELRFWNTVRYLVAEYYQRTVGRSWHARLAESVAKGMGCEVDFERAADLYLLALHYRGDRLGTELIREIADECGDEQSGVATCLRLLADGDDAKLRAFILSEFSLGRLGSVINAYGALSYAIIHQRRGA